MSRKEHILNLDRSLVKESEILSDEEMQEWLDRAHAGDWVAIEFLYCEAVVGLEPRRSLQRRRRASKRPSIQHDVFLCAATMIFDGEIRFDDRGFASAVALEMTLQGAEITAAGVRKHLAADHHQSYLKECQAEQDREAKSIRDKIYSTASILIEEGKARFEGMDFVARIKKEIRGKTISAEEIRQQLETKCDWWGNSLELRQKEFDEKNL